MPLLCKQLGCPAVLRTTQASQPECRSPGYPAAQHLCPIDIYAQSTQLIGHRDGMVYGQCSRGLLGPLTSFSIGALLPVVPGEHSGRGRTGRQVLVPAAAQSLRAPEHPETIAYDTPIFLENENGEREGAQQLVLGGGQLDRAAGHAQPRRRDARACNSPTASPDTRNAQEFAFPCFPSDSRYSPRHRNAARTLDKPLKYARFSGRRATSPICTPQLFHLRVASLTASIPQRFPIKPPTAIQEHLRQSCTASLTRHSWSKSAPLPYIIRNHIIWNYGSSSSSSTTIFDARA